MNAYIFQGLDGWPQVALVVVIAVLFLAGMAWLFKKVEDETYGLGAWAETVPPPVHTDTMTDEEEPSVLISAKALRELVEVAEDPTGIEAGNPYPELAEAIEEALAELAEYPIIPHVPTKEQA